MSSTRLSDAEMLGRVLDLASPVSDPDSFDPTIAARTAMNWRMGSRLFQEIRSRRLEAAFPAATLDALRGAHLSTVMRNRMLRRAAVETLRALARAGLRPMVLKGGVELLTTPADGTCTRFMEDIDLLLPPGESQAAQHALVAEGFEPTRFFPDYPDLHHGPVLSDPRSGLLVEVHHQPLQVDRPAFTAMLLAESHEIPIEPGLTVRAPGPHHQLLHNMIHAQESHFSFVLGTTDLRQLFEFGEKFRRFRSAVDWSRLQREAADFGLGAHLRSWVWAAHRVFRLPLPDGFSPRPIERQQARHICIQARRPRWLHSAERAAITHWFVLERLLRPCELSVFYRYWWARGLELTFRRPSPPWTRDMEWPRGRQR